MSSFSVKKSDVTKIIGALVNEEPTIRDAMERKMNLITEVVYKTARARRPKISSVQQKALGRKTSKGSYRVSDSDARLGVPVDTGALQTSIKKEVKWEGDKIVGTVTAGEDLPYAVMIEFGTSKMRARPFMRPAWNENLEWIKKKWKEAINRL